MRYRNKADETVTVWTAAGENTTFCAGVKPNSTFEYRSLYIPEEMSIDTFALAWTAYGTAFPAIYSYDRSEWEVLAVSDETASDGGGKNTLIDGNLGTYWHSQWDGGDAPLPHWVVIDMVSSKKIVKFEVYRRPGNTDARTVQCFIGSDADADADSWELVAEGVFSSGDKLTIDIPSTVDTQQGRYLKIVLPDSNRDPFISIAEVYVFGN